MTTKARTFTKGKLVEFRRESWDREWVSGEYMEALSGMPGWHRVKRLGFGGDKFTVPTRRIRVWV